MTNSFFLRYYRGQIRLSRSLNRIYKRLIKSFNLSTFSSSSDLSWMHPKKINSLICDATSNNFWQQLNTHRAHPFFTTLTAHGGIFLPPDGEINYLKNAITDFDEFFFQSYVLKADAFKNQSFDALPLKRDLEIQSHALFQSSFHITVPISSPRWATDIIFWANVYVNLLTELK